MYQVDDRLNARCMPFNVRYYKFIRIFSIIIIDNNILNGYTQDYSRKPVFHRHHTRIMYNTPKMKKKIEMQLHSRQSAHNKSREGKVRKTDVEQKFSSNKFLALIQNNIFFNRYGRYARQVQICIRLGAHVRQQNVQKQLVYTKSFIFPACTCTK